MEIRVLTFPRDCLIRGFSVKRGFIGAFVNRRLVAISSGWSNPEGGDVFVYRRRNGKWVGEWVFPAAYGVPGVMRAVMNEVLRKESV